MQRHIDPVTTQHIDGLNGSFLVQAERDVLVQTRVTTSSGSKMYTLQQRFDFTDQQTYTHDTNFESFAAYTRVHTRMRVSQDLDNGRHVATTVTVFEEYPISGEAFYEPSSNESFYLETSLNTARSWALQVESSPLAQQHNVTFRPTFAPLRTHTVLLGSGVMDSRIGGNDSMQVSHRSSHESGVCFTRYAAARYGKLTMDVNATVACGSRLDVGFY